MTGRNLLISYVYSPASVCRGHIVVGRSTSHPDSCVEHARTICRASIAGPTSEPELRRVRPRQDPPTDIYTGLGGEPGIPRRTQNLLYPWCWLYVQGRSSPHTPMIGPAQRYFRVRGPLGSSYVMACIPTTCEDSHPRTRGFLSPQTRIKMWSTTMPFECCMI